MAPRTSPEQKQASVERKLAEANHQLRQVDKYRLTLFDRGNRIWVEGYFPPRPGSTRTTPYRQKFSLGCNVTSEGIKAALRKAQEMGDALRNEQFSWTTTLEEEDKPKEKTVADWMERFEEEYFRKQGRTNKSETNWRAWRYILDKLPQDGPLTSKVIENTIFAGELEPGEEANTAKRKELCVKLKSFAKFAELKLEFDIDSYRGNYDISAINPDDIPGDAKIEEWYGKINNKSWKWVYGILATYGLRPHEIFHLDLTELCAGGQIIIVGEETKTGRREVWPCYPEWVEEFHLREVSMPDIHKEGRLNIDLGKKITPSLKLQLRRGGVPEHEIQPFVAYYLRHAWAIRTINFKWPVALAAVQMGHSVDVHTKRYHRALSRHHHQEAFEAIMNRADRPMPPCVQRQQANADR